MQVHKQTQGCIEYKCMKCMSEHVCMCGQCGFALIMYHATPFTDYFCIDFSLTLHNIRGIVTPHFTDG